jgi:potassium-dependent mechanosensitive channel
MTRLVRLLLVLVMTLAVPAGAVLAQDEDAPRATGVPSAFEAASRSRVITDSAAVTQRSVSSLLELQDLEDEASQMEQRLVELRIHIASVTEAEYMRPERLSRIRDNALQHQQRLEGLLANVGERLEQLEGYRTEWLERQEFWDDWRSQLVAQGRLENVSGDFSRAFAAIGETRDVIEEAIPRLMALQNDIAALRDESERSADYVAEVRANRRQSLAERTAPLLLSHGHRNELSPAAIAEWRPLGVITDSLRPAFLRENSGTLLLHALLVLIVALAARRLRHISIPEGAWSGLLLRWRALAAFVSTALVASAYAFAPALWDVVIWALLAGSSAVLATRLIPVPSVRRMVYAFAVLYPAFLLAEALLTPAPFFRLLLAGVALVGLLHFARLWRLETKDHATGTWASWTLAIGTAMWLVIFLAEVLGFYLLARWVLHATITSAYVVFVVVFVVVMVRGGLGTLMRLESGTGFVRTVGVPLAERLLRLIQVVLVVVAFLQILDIWELALSPAETWRRFTGIGFTLAGTEITIGRIIMAFVLVYLTILASWLVRTFTRSEVYPRWELERGVGESINSLVHYTLIFLGIMIGLGALGVELQNFAIVAGALGVGIGFGLQNVVNNFVSGLILLFERPVRPGDTVVVGTELGTIKKIGLRSTTVMTFDRAEVIVPNGDLVSEKVTNWTLTDPVARLILPVGVAYGTEVHLVLRLLHEAAENHPDVLKDPVPQTLFMEFGDSALEFELRVWVQELALRLKVRSEILAEIDRLFRENDIEIPFPQRDLHVRSLDPKLLSAFLESAARKHDESRDAGKSDGH